MIGATGRDVELAAAAATATARCGRPDRESMIPELISAEAIVLQP